MPKNRKRLNQKGAKSLSIRTKFKVGGRKSGRGVKQTSTNDLRAIIDLGYRSRDYNKIKHELDRRGIALT